MDRYQERTARRHAAIDEECRMRAAERAEQERNLPTDTEVDAMLAELAPCVREFEERERFRKAWNEN